MARRRRFSFWLAPMDHAFIRVLEDYFRGQLTVIGRVLLLGTATATLLLLGGLEPPLLAVFSFGVTALAAALVVGAFFRPAVHVERQLPGWPSAGALLRYRVRVENRGRRVARAITVEERQLDPDLRAVGTPQVIATLAPGESATVELQLQCLHRGAYELRGLQTASAFPAGLVKVSRRTKRPDRLLVLPRFAPMTEFEIPIGRNHQPGGITVASAVGDSTEFLGTREHRTGDSLRQIHWPSTARTGRLISKEFQEEYFVRLALVLDIAAPHREGEERLERALSVAAALADALARRDYIIDLFAAGPTVYHFQAGRALAHIDNLLEILACLEPGHHLDVAALESLLLPEAERLSAVILVALDWDEPRAALAARLRSLGIALRVILLRSDVATPDLGPGERVSLP
jgi:uncharacterized protein (DUF58 family)